MPPTSTASTRIGADAESVESNGPVSARARDSLLLRSGHVAKLEAEMAHAAAEGRFAEAIILRERIQTAQDVDAARQAARDALLSVTRPMAE